MYAPLIVGIEHDREQGTLLNQYCQTQFQNKILPRIDSDTLILLEGSYEVVLHKGEDELYFWNKHRAEQFIGTRIGSHSPTIGYRDGRYLNSPEAHESYELIYYAASHIHPCISLAQPAPQTHIELCAAFSTGRLRYDVRASWWYRKRRNLRYCRETLGQLIQFDWPMIAAAREWQSGGGRVIILCGSIHAFTMHRSTGWPAIFLAEEDPEKTHELTIGLISYSLYPEATLGRAPLILR